jgi:putative transposase
MKHETFLQNEKAQELAKLLAGSCEDLGDVQTLLKNLFKGTLEEMLESEMDEHLGYDKHSAAGNNTGNSRNGYNKKTLQSEFGEIPVSVPRDRKGDFEPKLIGKYQTKTDDLENRIIAMYAKGMSNRDIEDHLRDIYGVEASASLISRITDKILPAVMEW